MKLTSCVVLAMLGTWTLPGFGAELRRTTVTIERHTIQVPDERYFDTLVEDYCPPPEYRRTYPACKYRVNLLEGEWRLVYMMLDAIKSDSRKGFGIGYKMYKAKQALGQLDKRITQFLEEREQSLYIKLHPPRSRN